MITLLAREHRERLAALIRATSEFTEEDAEVALEVADASLDEDNSSGAYRTWVDIDDAARLRGYICYGATPMTQGTYDLYWIAVSPSFKGRGVGRGLVAQMEDELARTGARLVRVETESSPAYQATRAFYEAIGYERAATIPSFYAEGRDLVIYTRYLARPS